jgi:hypothetical protein
MTQRRTAFSVILLASRFTSFVAAAEPAFLADTIEKIKPSIVAVGTFQIRRPRQSFVAQDLSVTGSIVTNAHVLPEKVDAEKREYVAIFAGRGETGDIREATKVAI